MVAERDAAVMIRTLPGGAWVQAAAGELSGSLLKVRLADTLVEHGFSVGGLVEIDAPETFYLGQIHGCDGISLVIGVEHAVDRRILSAVREAWSPARG